MLGTARAFDLTELTMRSLRSPRWTLLTLSLAGAFVAVACTNTPSSQPGGGDSGPDNTIEAGPDTATPGDGAPPGDGATLQARSNALQTPLATLPSDAIDVAVAANNAFAVDLYAHVQSTSDAGAGNLVTAPVSASLALTMAYAGANGATAVEMASALHVDTDAGVSIFDGQNALSQSLALRGPAALASVQQSQRLSDAGLSPSDYVLQIVNAVWGQTTYPWAPSFLDVLAQSYGAGVYLTDFELDPEASRQAINGWVGTSTDGKVLNLLPRSSLDTSTRMVLVDTIHAKLPWATSFDESLTASGTFTREDGTTVSVDFMNQTGTLAYADDGQAQIAALPLAGGQVTVMIALPHAGVDLATYEASLTASSAALRVPAASQLVALTLPKTSFTSPTFSLKGALQAMGMVQAFQGDADFTPMVSGPPPEALYVHDVLQKATLSMEETGLEAAAATAVIIFGDGGIDPDAAPPVIVPMQVNRPYLVAIVDAPTGAILFLGHILDPTDVGGP